MYNADKQAVMDGYRPQVTKLVNAAERVSQADRDIIVDLVLHTLGEVCDAIDRTASNYGDARIYAAVVIIATELIGKHLQAASEAMQATLPELMENLNGL